MPRWPLLALIPLCACVDKASGDSGDPAVSWYVDIEPLVQKSCASCHDGAGVGKVNLTDAATAQSMADVMAGYVSAGLMPPPSSDPDCRSYGGDERMTLTEDEKALISAWAEAGAPLGDPDNAPAPVTWGTRIDDPDVVLTMPIAHELQVDLDGNEYFCTVVDNPLDEDAWITGLDVAIGNASVAHHMLLVVDEGGDAGDAYGDTDGSDGFDCRNPIMENDWRVLHAWAPGMDATLLPEGTGLPIEAGAQIVIQMHYFALGDTGGTLDQSGYKLKLTTDRPDVEINMDAIGPAGFRISAGEAEHTETDSYLNEYLDVTAFGVFPHMHLLGTSYKNWITESDGSETCMVEGDYSFDHQAFYIFDEPVLLGVGDTWNGSCTWDNSTSNPNQYNDPPEDVRYGEGTNQEMCYFLTYYAVGDHTSR